MVVSVSHILPDLQLRIESGALKIGFDYQLVTLLFTLDQAISQQENPGFIDYNARRYTGLSVKRGGCMKSNTALIKSLCVFVGVMGCAQLSFAGICTYMDYWNIRTTLTIINKLPSNPASSSNFISIVPVANFCMSGAPDVSSLVAPDGGSLKFQVLINTHSFVCDVKNNYQRFDVYTHRQ